MKYFDNCINKPKYLMEHELGLQKHQDLPKVYFLFYSYVFIKHRYFCTSNKWYMDVYLIIRFATFISKCMKSFGL